MELAERRVFLAEMREKLVSPESARQILGLDTGLVVLVDAGSTCCPERVRPAERHEVWSEVAK